MIQHRDAPPLSWQVRVRNQRLAFLLIRVPQLFRVYCHFVQKKTNKQRKTGCQSPSVSVFSLKGEILPNPSPAGKFSQFSKNMA